MFPLPPTISRVHPAQLEADYCLGFIAESFDKCATWIGETFILMSVINETVWRKLGLKADRGCYNSCIIHNNRVGGWKCVVVD